MMSKSLPDYYMDGRVVLKWSTPVIMTTGVIELMIIFPFHHSGFVNSVKLYAYVILSLQAVTRVNVI